MCRAQSLSAALSMPSKSLCHDSHVLEYSGPEPLAIVGMAMRLPGGINCAEKFWEFLVEQKDGHGKVPESRYNVDAFHHPARAGSVRTQHGYFLQEDPTYFDHQFFSITPYEAARLDPQQRLLLEVIYECMETGGQVGWRGKGRNIGCFVGVFGEDWYDLQSKDTQRIDRYHVLGTGYFALSNRVSYEFDFTGPRYQFTKLLTDTIVSATLFMPAADQDIKPQHDVGDGMLRINGWSP